MEGQNVVAKLYQASDGREIVQDPDGNYFLVVHKDKKSAWCFSIGPHRILWSFPIHYLDTAKRVAGREADEIAAQLLKAGGSPKRLCRHQENGPASLSLDRDQGNRPAAKPTRKQKRRTSPPSGPSVRRNGRRRGRARKNR